MSIKEIALAAMKALEDGRPERWWTTGTPAPWITEARKREHDLAAWILRVAPVIERLREIDRRPIRGRTLAEERELNRADIDDAIDALLAAADESA